MTRKAAENHTTSETLGRAEADACRHPLDFLQGGNQAAGADDSAILRERFRTLVRTWKKERGPTSSVLKMAAHPAYQAIINMGHEALPLLLAELEREPDHWFVALHQLTGVDPVPKESRGRLQDMATAWIRWGRENSLSW